LSLVTAGSSFSFKDQRRCLYRVTEDVKGFLATVEIQKVRALDWQRIAACRAADLIVLWNVKNETLLTSGIQLGLEYTSSRIVENEPNIDVRNPSITYCWTAFEIFATMQRVRL
jgi:hypothetical protein